MALFSIIATLLLVATVPVPTSPGTDPGAGSRTWGGQEVVAPFDSDYFDVPPLLVRARANGTAVAVWKESWRGPLVAAERRADGTWTSPTAVTGRIAFSSDYEMPYDLAVGPGGLASFVWQRHVRGTMRVVESHLRSGRWTAPHAVGRGYEPSTTIDGHGLTSVAWAGDGIRIARRHRVGPWRSEQVSAADGSLVQLASNAAGDLAVAWWGGTEIGIQASTRPQGGRWTRTRDLGLDQGTRVWVTGVHASVDQRGRALVVWATSGLWDQAQREYVNYVAWSRGSSDGVWTPTRRLTDKLGEDGGDLSVSTRPGGTAIATWRENYYDSDDAYHAWAARFGPDGTWSTPARIALRPAYVAPEVWLDRHGVAHGLVGEPFATFRQRPGRPWRFAGSPAPGGWLADADARGRHAVAVYVDVHDGLLCAIEWTDPP